MATRDEFINGIIAQIQRATVPYVIKDTKTERLTIQYRAPDHYAVHNEFTGQDVEFMTEMDLRETIGDHFDHVTKRRRR